MARNFTIVLTLIAAGIFAWVVPLVRLFGAVQPLIVALSIMVAAVFVRLNRGMPTLEWKTLDPEKRKDLTASILKVTVEYGWIMAINAFALLALVTLSVVGATEASHWPIALRKAASGAIGGSIALCIARMAYVVWRDIDIVRLQKRLIDGVATNEALERQRALADDKVKEFKAANLRRVPIDKPKAWGE